MRLMTTSDTKKILLRQISKLRKEITELRIKLNDINEKKEAQFEEKEGHSKKISELIRNIRAAKSQRNSYTDEVKRLKERRKELNKQIKDKIQEAKSFNKERKEISKKYNIQGNPALIKEQIEKLEYKVETEAVPFSEEKKIMKKIHDLKQDLEEINKVSDVWNRLHAINSNIEKLKTEANSVHTKVQENAVKSQEKHEEMLLLSKEIDEFKVKEQEAYKKFTELKEEFTGINEKLKERLVSMNEINEKIKQVKTQKKIEKQEQEKITLQQKTEIVEDKIKKKKKLTTEDLLVFQKNIVEEKQNINSTS